MRQVQVVVVLLNWNAWQDTVACIASLFASSAEDFAVVVCDNASSDDSWQQIKAWCQGNVKGGCESWAPGHTWDSDSRIALIQTGANLGFAGGCNVGIRFALQHTRCDYLWLLNNDTIVDPQAMQRQIECMKENLQVGMLGSTLIYASAPETVQCFGGYSFNFWNARVRALPFPPDPEHRPSASAVEPVLRYVSGASTFVRRSFVEAVGLLNEQYFLYFEEIDWAVRGAGFRMSYCPDSTVFHKEGRSIGSSRSAVHRSVRSELWLTRNRILFTRTYFPLRTLIVVLWVLMVAAVRMLRGNRELGKVLVKGVVQGLRAPTQPLPNVWTWPASTLEAAEHIAVRGHHRSGDL